MISQILKQIALHIFIAFIGLKFIVDRPLIKQKSLHENIPDRIQVYLDFYPSLS